MPPKAVKGEYIETDTGNKVSRKSVILGSQNIILGGKTVIQADAMLRGDLKRALQPGSAAGDKGSQSNVAIAIGRYCFISKGVVLKPPAKSYKGVFTHTPLHLASHIFIGPNSVIEAASIGSYVHIGANVIIKPFVIIKDVVRILPGTILAAGTVVPSFSVVGGRPGRVVGELSSAAAEGLELREVVRAVGNG